MTDSVAKSPDANRELELSKAALREIGQEILTSKGQAPFKLPEKVDALIERAKNLNSARQGDEIELSAILHKMEEDRVYLQFNYKSLSDYADGELRIAGSTARSMISNWRMFLDLGLDPKILSGPQGVMFSKFKLLSKAIRTKQITPANIAEWLPLIRKDGPGAAPRKVIETQVDNLTATAGEDAVVSKRFSFALRPEEAVGFLDTLEVLKESYGVESDGQAIFQAVIATAAAQIEDAAKQATCIGLIGLSNMMARLAPVTPIMYSEDPNVSFNNLGVHVVSKVYAVFRADKNVSNFCLAPNKAAAADALSVSESSVREFDLVISSELKSEATYEGGLISEEEPEIISEGDSNMTITESDINKSVSYNIKEKDGTVKQASGTISEVDLANQIARVKAGRGRPRAVPFAAIISVGDGARPAPAPKKAEGPAETPAPKRRGRPPKAAKTSVDIDISAAKAVKTMDANLAEIQRIGASLAAAGKPADVIKTHYEEALSHATASGYEGDERKALAAHSTLQFCKKLAES